MVKLVKRYNPSSFSKGDFDTVGGVGGEAAVDRPCGEWVLIIREWDRQTEAKSLMTIILVRISCWFSVLCSVVILELCVYMGSYRERESAGGRFASAL